MHSQMCMLADIWITKTMCELKLMINVAEMHRMHCHMLYDLKNMTTWNWLNHIINENLGILLHWICFL